MTSYTVPLSDSIVPMTTPSAEDYRKYFLRTVRASEVGPRPIPPSLPPPSLEDAAASGAGLVARAQTRKKHTSGGDEIPPPQTMADCALASAGILQGGLQHGGFSIPERVENVVDVLMFISDVLKKLVEIKDTVDRIKEKNDKRDKKKEKEREKEKEKAATSDKKD